MAGAGTMPAGLGPFGLGTPVTSATPPTGAAGCRYINPATRDYQQDPVSKQLAQMPANRQRVLLAATTEKGSSTALPDFGVLAPRKVGPSYEAEVKASVHESLRQMTEVERVIRTDELKVEVGVNRRQRVTISYTDVASGEPDQLKT